MKRLLLLLCLWLVPAYAVTVAITHGSGNKYTDASGRNVTGTIDISWKSFATGTGTNVAAGSTRVTIDPSTPGEFTVSLVANDTADPPVFYTVRFSSARATFDQQWVVPSVAGPLTVNDVVRSSMSPITILPSQISKVGAVAGDIIYYHPTDGWKRLARGTNGQSLTIDTSLAGYLKWATVSGGGGGTWGSITGTLSNQTDLASALGAKLAIANNLSDLASASTARTNLGLGTAATAASSSFAAVSNNLSDLASASTARTNLGLGTAATSAASAFEVPLTFAARLNRTVNSVDLASGIVSPGSCGDSTHSCGLTVDTYGRVTAATNNAISATGTGDLVGPSSATDNCFGRFDGTTGKLVQNGSVCADDSGNITTPGSFTGGSGSTAGATAVFGNSTGDTGASSLTLNSGDGASNTEPAYLHGRSSHSTKRDAFLFPCTDANGAWCISGTTPVADASNVVLTADNTATVTGKSIAASQLTGTILAARLPNPAASAIGGVQSKTCTSGDFISAINTDGTETCGTPSGGGGGGSLPSQTGNANKILITDGTNPSWSVFTDWHDFVVGECTGAVAFPRISYSSSSPISNLQCSGATNATGNGLLAEFSTGLTSQIFYRMLLPPSYVDGTAFTVKLHWVTPSTTTSNTIITDVAATCTTYGAAAPDGQYDNKAYNTAVAATVNPIATAYGAQVTTYASVSATGCVNTRSFYLRIRRTGGTESNTWLLWGGQIGFQRLIN